jgi:hypothetical protein
MQRAKIRNYALVVLAVLAAASMFPSFGGGGTPHRANPRPHRPPAVAAKARPQVRASFRIER